MKKISSITALGVLVLIVASPFIAISREWKSYIFMVCGLAIIILSLFLREELHKVLKIIHETMEVKSDTYVENNPR